MNSEWIDLEIDLLVGKTLVKAEEDGDTITFETSDGEVYQLLHEQDCCESVTIEDICGDLDDLVGSPIIEAEEVTSGENPAGIVKEYPDSFTWTFYKMGTAKGFVTLRWYGESNGYYSESVNFIRIK